MVTLCRSSKWEIGSCSLQKMSLSSVIFHLFVFSKMGHCHRFCFPTIVVLEERDLHEAAEAMRPHMERTMKLEVAPWLRGTDVDMDTLFCELTLEQYDKDYFVTRRKQTLDGYEQLFTVEHRIGVCKVLTTGDPGMGKTTLAKKMAWDWAREQFRKFELIFVIFLKFVEPEETIERAIAKQNPWMEGLGISAEKLGQIMEIFPKRCLLILDGLDEHDFGKNADIVRIIEGRKLLHCSTFLTSRPHCTVEIQEHSNTIARVEGFTLEKAREFAFKILKDGAKVEQVLKFKNLVENKENSSVREGEELRHNRGPRDDQDEPGEGHRSANNDQGSTLYRCPILLSFLCILVRDDPTIDLTQKTMERGEIYARMVSCLFKKYTLRKGVQFQKEEFHKMLRAVGKLAWETLPSGNPLLHKSQVLEEVGEDAFEYGLLIGDDSLMSCVDAMADVLITFPHESIQEFLAAFFFLWMLSQGQSIKSLIGDTKPIFLHSPLFLHFCLWFLGCSKDSFGLAQEKVRASLVSYTAEQVNSVQMVDRDLERFPALLNNTERLTMSFLQDVVSRCDKAKHLATRGRNLSLLLDSVDASSLKTIFCSGFTCSYLYAAEEKDNSLCFSIEDWDFNIDSTSDLRQDNRPVSLHFKDYSAESYGRPEVQEKVQTLLSQFCNSNVTLQTNFPLKITGTFPVCPRLTGISFSNREVNARKVIAAVEEGKIPALTCLKLMSPISSESLFCLPSLSELTELHVRVSQHDDVNSLFSVLRKWLRQMQMLSLQGTSPALSIDVQNLGKTLSSLEMVRFSSIMFDLKAVKEQLNYKKLKRLDFAFCRFIGGQVEDLVSQRFPVLETLGLGACHLKAKDLSSLAVPSVGKRLPSLKHLDVSDPQDHLQHLFEQLCRWNELLSLKLGRCCFGTDKFLGTKVQQGCLRSLLSLTLMEMEPSDLFTTVWPNLRTLETLELNTKLCSALVECKQKGLLPALSLLRIGYSQGDCAETSFPLRRAGVAVSEW